MCRKREPDAFFLYRTICARWQTVWSRYGAVSTLMLGNKLTYGPARAQVHWSDRLHDMEILISEQ